VANQQVTAMRPITEWFVVHIGDESNGKAAAHLINYPIDNVIINDNLFI